MAMTYATVSGRVTQPGTDIGIRARVTATPMTTQSALLFPSENRMTWGSQSAETNATGTLADLDVPTNHGLSELYWRIDIEPLDKIPGLPAKWTMGTFEITADVRLEDLVQVDVTTVTGDLITTVAELLADAEAAALLWQPSVAVTSGATRQAPDGSRIKSTASRTTRSSFDATEKTFWKSVLGTAGTMESDDLSASTAQTAGRSPLLSPKVLGGNITVKPGYGWLQLHSEWDWDHWIKPQVDRAAALGLNAVRLIGAPHAPLTAPTFANWQTSATYSTPDIIRTANGGLYILTTGGVTASSGSGPSGTGSSITDGTCVWKYVGAPLTQISQSTYDAQWEQLATYCATKGLSLYPALCDQGAFDAVASGDYTNSSMVASVCATAETLAQYANVIGFDIFQEGDLAVGYAWEASRGYSVGARVYNTSGKGYIATTGGTSAASGGPTGTGTGITDGSVVWNYDHEALLPSDVLSVYASVRAVAGNIPLTTSIAVSSGFAFDDHDAWWTTLYTSTGGPDFIDLHLYLTDVTPRDIDYLAFKSGKPFLIGEFGANQSLSSGDQLARFAAIRPIHQRTDVRGSFVWALADQGANSSARLAGVWDNTGYVRGSAALSTSSGKRTPLTDALAAFAKATPPAQWEPPNLLTPERSRPVPAISTLPGSRVASWSAGTNTTRVADPRGLGFSCTAGGTATRAAVGATVVDPVAVTAGTAYEFSVSLQAQGIGRSGIIIFVDWHDASKAYISTSAVATGYDLPDVPTRASINVVAPAGAVYAQPTVEWPSSQVTGEVHLITGSYFGLPRRDIASTFMPPHDPYAADRLAVGQETMHRALITTTANLTSGFMRTTFFTARTWDVVAKIRTLCGTAAGATPTLCKVGLFTVAANGNLTLVASTANTTSLWSAGSTSYETALSSSYTLNAGSRYAIGLLCVTGASAPSTYVSNSGASAELGLSPRMSALVTGLTDLPSSVSAGSLSDSATRPYAVLLP